MDKLLTMRVLAFSMVENSLPHIGCFGWYTNTSTFIIREKD